VLENGKVRCFHSNAGMTADSFWRRFIPSVGGTRRLGTR
jgi:hypothetical protein